MARGNQDIVKKNSKLESFLHRALTGEAYDRVRGYESCICVSEKENKAFKYVVLSDEWIYLTENPPKAIKAVVHLRDVVNIELINDLPAFLSGEEQQDTQHIAVTHVTSEPASRRSLRRNRHRSPHGSMTDLVDRSNNSTPMSHASSLDGSEDIGYFTQSTTSLPHSRPTSRGSVGSQREGVRGNMAKKNKKPPQPHQPPISEDWEQDSILKEEIEEDMFEDIEADGLSVSRSHHNLDRVSEPFLPSHDRCSIRSNAHSVLSVDSLSASQTSIRPMPPHPKSGAFEISVSAQKVKADKAGIVEVSDKKSGCSCTPLFCRGSSRSQVAPICKTDNKEDTTMFTSKTHLIGNSKRGIPSVGISRISDDSQECCDGRESLNSRLSPILGSGPLGAETPLLDVERLAHGSHLPSELSGSINGLHTLSVDGTNPEKRQTVLHIYLLKSSSPMFMLIRGAWSNYLIRATLALETGITEASPVLNSQNQREQCEQLFNQLKQQMFDANNSMEDYYQLFADLKRSALKNFFMKKLFWRSGDIFALVVQQIQKYMPYTEANLHSEKGRSQRVDELTYVILLVNLLCTMFRESEILAIRMQALKTERGKYVIDLLMTLTSTLNVPEKQILLMKHWTAPCKNNRFGSTTSTTMNRDAELYQLLSDYIRMSITAVFELFLMAKQNQFEQDESLHFTVGWIIKVMEECKNTEQFVERLMSQVLEVINLARFGAVSSQQAVCLYQQFTILLAILEHNPSILDFLRNHYHEEFKYFIQGPALARKLPSQLPITPTTLHVVSQVSGKVLGNSTKEYNHRK